MVKVLYQRASLHLSVQPWEPAIQLLLHILSTKSLEPSLLQSLSHVLAPMCFPVSVTVANLVMKSVDESALATYHCTLLFWKWYVHNSNSYALGTGPRLPCASELHWSVRSVYSWRIVWQWLPQEPSRHRLAFRNTPTLQPMRTPQRPQWPSTRSATYWKHPKDTKPTGESNLFLTRLHSTPGIGEIKGPYSTTTQGWCGLQDPMWNMS